MDGGDHSGGGSQQRALIIWQEDPLARYKTTTENAPGGQHDPTILWSSLQALFARHAAQPTTPPAPSIDHENALPSSSIPRLVPSMSIDPVLDVTQSLPMTSDLPECRPAVKMMPVELKKGSNSCDLDLVSLSLKEALRTESVLAALSDGGETESATEAARPPSSPHRLTAPPSSPYGNLPPDGKHRPTEVEHSLQLLNRPADYAQSETSMSGEVNGDHPAMPLEKLSAEGTSSPTPACVVDEVAITTPNDNSETTDRGGSVAEGERVDMELGDRPQPMAIRRGEKEGSDAMKSGTEVESSPTEIALDHRVSRTAEKDRARVEEEEEVQDKQVDPVTTKGQEQVEKLDGEDFQVLEGQRKGDKEEPTDRGNDVEAPAATDIVSECAAERKTTLNSVTDPATQPSASADRDMFHASAGAEACTGITRDVIERASPPIYPKYVTAQPLSPSVNPDPEEASSQVGTGAMISINIDTQPATESSTNGCITQLSDADLADSIRLPGCENDRLFSPSVPTPSVSNISPLTSTDETKNYPRVDQAIEAPPSIATPAVIVDRPVDDESASADTAEGSDAFHDTATKGSGGSDVNDNQPGLSSDESPILAPSSMQHEEADVEDSSVQHGSNLEPPTVDSEQQKEGAVLLISSPAPSRPAESSRIVDSSEPTAATPQEKLVNDITGLAPVSSATSHSTSQHDERSHPAGTSHLSSASNRRASPEDGSQIDSTPDPPQAGTVIGETDNDQKPSANATEAVEPRNDANALVKRKLPSHQDEGGGDDRDGPVEEPAEEDEEKRSKRPRTERRAGEPETATGSPPSLMQTPIAEVDDKVQTDSPAAARTITIPIIERELEVQYASEIEEPSSPPSATASGTDDRYASRLAEEDGTLDDNKGQWRVGRLPGHQGSHIRKKDDQSGSPGLKRTSAQIGAQDSDKILKKPFRLPAKVTLAPARPKPPVSPDNRVISQDKENENQAQDLQTPAHTPITPIRQTRPTKQFVVPRKASPEASPSPTFSKLLPPRPRKPARSFTPIALAAAPPPAFKIPATPASTSSPVNTDASGGHHPSSSSSLPASSPISSARASKPFKQPFIRSTAPSPATPLTASARSGPRTMSLRERIMELEKQERTLKQAIRYQTHPDEDEDRLTELVAIWKSAGRQVAEDLFSVTPKPDATADAERRQGQGGWDSEAYGNMGAMGGGAELTDEQLEYLAMAPVNDEGDPLDEEGNPIFGHVEEVNMAEILEKRLAQGGGVDDGSSTSTFASRSYGEYTKPKSRNDVWDIGTMLEKIGVDDPTLYGWDAEQEDWEQDGEDDLPVG